MKAKIIREIGEFNWYKVYAEGKLIKCFCYKDNLPEDDTMNEAKVFSEAMELVKRIEASEKFPLEETIYETKY